MGRSRTECSLAKQLQPRQTSNPFNQFDGLRADDNHSGLRVSTSTAAVTARVC